MVGCSVSEEEDGFSEYAKPTGAYAEALAKSAARREKKLIEKSQETHNAPMIGTPQEREERDKQRQWAIYEKTLSLRKAELLAGPSGHHFALLIKFLNQMTLDDAGTLIEGVKNSIWLSDADQTDKNDALWLIDTYIIRLRVKNGMSPFSDPLMEDPPNAFLIIRKTLTGVGHIT